MGEKLVGEGESLFKWFRALSLTTPFCTHSATGSGGRGRGDIKGFRNPKKAFKVLLYNADTKAAAAAARHCDRRLDVRVPVLRPQAFPFFFRMACGKLFQIFMKNNQPLLPLRSGDDLISLKYSPAARDSRENDIRRCHCTASRKGRSGEFKGAEDGGGEEVKFGEGS